MTSNLVMRGESPKVPPFCEKSRNKEKIWRPIEPEESDNECRTKYKNSSSGKELLMSVGRNPAQSSSEKTRPTNSFQAYCNFYKQFKFQKPDHLARTSSIDNNKMFPDNFDNPFLKTWNCSNTKQRSEEPLQFKQGKISNY